MIIQNGILNAERYVEEILNEHLGPFMARIYRDGILMDDNARPRTAGIVNEHLGEVGIELMQWPARSPDLSLIEPAWDELERCLKHRNSPPITLPELRQALVEEWGAIPQNWLRNLVFSMPNHLKGARRAR